jgi:hypothetical protein
MVALCRLSMPSEPPQIVRVVRPRFCAVRFYKPEKFLQTVGRIRVGFHKSNPDFKIAQAIGYPRIQRDSLDPNQTVRLQRADRHPRACTEQSGRFYATSPQAHFRQAPEDEPPFPFGPQLNR